jgi:DNA-binding GntR family transcriptional regulator
MFAAACLLCKVSPGGLPASRVPDLDERDLAGSLYRYLEPRGLLPETGEEAVVGDLPSAEETGLLDIATSRPFLRMVRRALRSQLPVE